MEFKFQQILAFLSVVLFVGSHAANLASKDYWKSVLPNTAMPKALRDLLQPSTEWRESKPFHVDFGCRDRRGDPGTGRDSSSPPCHINIGFPFTPPLGFRSSPISFPLTSTSSTAPQLHENPNEALFFLRKDLHPDKRMNLHLSKSTNSAKFLPRRIADSIPFSSNKLPEILDKFSVDPSSEKAGVIKETIQECEDAGVEGEEKLCVTSLESMVDFSTSRLGKDVEVMSTEAEMGKMKEYRIVGVKRMSCGRPVVDCHKKEYPYAVFYCHKARKMVTYKVSMVAADSSKADAVAVCHQDTSAWDPKHLAFQVLNVKPGTIAVCHFLPEDHIVWANEK